MDIWLIFLIVLWAYCGIISWYEIVRDMPIILIGDYIMLILAIFIGPIAVTMVMFSEYF